MFYAQQCQLVSANGKKMCVLIIFQIDVNIATGRKIAHLIE